MTTDSARNCRILFVGFTVLDDVVERICKVDRYMPFQTHKFAWSIVRGLEANGAIIDLLSAEPVANYPDNPQILFKYIKLDRGNSSWYVMMPFVNLLVVKHFTRFISCFLLTTRWLINNRHVANRVILLHGVHSAFLYAVLILRMIFNFKSVTIVSDPPGVSQVRESLFTKLLRKSDAGIIKRALQSMNGLIVLTKQLSSCFAPLVPSIVVEGILYAEDYTAKAYSQIDLTDQDTSCFTILYAGGLQSEYGVELLLEAFSLTKDPSMRLCIMGKGELADKIHTASQIDTRIVFKGYCQQNELKYFMSKASVLINPRPSNQPFTQFSFPSKTIEYMASGRPFITTRLPGIPEEYFRYVITLEKETADELATLFKQLKEMPIDSLNKIGSEAKEYVLNNKSESIQGQRILSLLNNI